MITMNRDIDTDGMTDHRSIRYFSQNRDVFNTSGTSEIIARKLKKNRLYQQDIYD